MNLYPVEGSRYRVTEWDGSENTVRVLAVTEDAIVFQYENSGPTHEVAPEHFVFELNPYPLPLPRSSGYYNIHLN